LRNEGSIQGECRSEYPPNGLFFETSGRDSAVIFRPKLVEKILAGEKTETRRVVKEGEVECRYNLSTTFAVQPKRTEPGVARILIK
jgi:hypothetical protein